MLIQVEYANSRYDLVQDYYLEALIEEGRIRRFRRRDGWAEIGRASLRRVDALFPGADRRAPVVHRPLDLPVRIGRNKIRPVFGGNFKP